MSLTDIKEIISNNEMLEILIKHQKSLEDEFVNKQHQNPLWRCTRLDEAFIQ